MAREGAACITYMRLRPAERRASAIASDQQCAAEQTLIEDGYTIAGRFGDDEFADPFSGWLEPRPAWAMACEEAQRIAAELGFCALAILRVEGIGTGDPFLPTPLQTSHNVDMIGLEFSAYPLLGSFPLNEAKAAFERHKSVCRALERSKPASKASTRAKGEIVFRRDARRGLVSAYYSNPTDAPLDVRWQQYCRPLLSASRWPDAPESRSLEIAGSSLGYIDTFFQGESEGDAQWWRFKLGTGRDTRVGNVIFSPPDFGSDALPLTWYAYEPEGLTETDFLWEERPSLQTQRLSLRNWRAGDAAHFAAHCNTPQVMRYLGGVQPPEELADDVSYFADAGRTGPTYWVIERLKDRAFLGFCGALVVEEDGSPVCGKYEIGWRLRADAWGQGFAYEAAAEVLRYLFEDLKIGLVVARIDSKNTGSQKLARRLGLIENPGRRHEGDPGQVLQVFELAREAYLASFTPALA